MLARAPEVIIELRAGDMPPPAETRQTSVRVWKLLASVPAVRNGRVHLLYGDQLVVPGPRLVRRRRAFARALHPEVFKCDCTRAHT